jgi:ABC-type multidrug transport system fused ATPase/permease subunit
LPPPDTAPPSPRSISTFAALVGVLREQPGRAAALMASSVAAGLAESMILALVAHVAAALVDEAGSVTIAVGPLRADLGVTTALEVAAVLAVVRLVLQIAIAYLPARMTADTQARHRARLFDAYSRADWDTQAQERDGHLQELVTSQVVQATNAMLHATMLVSSGFVFLTLVAAAFAINPLVALLVLAVVGGLSVLLRPVGRRGRRHAKALSAAQLAFAGRIGTAVRMAEETYTFDVAAAERAEVGERIEVARHHFAQAQFAQRVSQATFQGLVIVLLVGALAVLHASGTGQIAGLGAVVLLLVRASSYGQQVQFSWQVVQQAAPFLERLGDAADTYRAHERRGGGRPFPAGEALRFEEVGFSYDGARRRDVLADVTFAVAPGEVIGVVGPSGAGKSTLVQLLLRMRRPTTGRYVVGTLPVDDIDLAGWRRSVAYVPQEPRLLDGTVADNIRYHRDIDPASIERAARLAHIDHDIQAMPGGYDTIVGHRADAVSGGQRQRLCLARALAGDPSVLVLDEPTSALDRESEAAIKSSLRGLRGRLTIVIVAHRPALLEICDRIFELDRGHLRVDTPQRVAPGP